jgi:hypothetical protein
VLHGRFEIPVSALAACLRWDNLGEGHPVVAESPLWRDERAERENDEAARAVLNRVGLFDSRGRLDAGFRDSLRVLARADVDYSCWARDSNGPSSALVAVIGRDVVLVVRNEDRLWLRAASPERPAEELVARLPEWRPARAQAINARLADYEALRAPGENIVAGGGYDAEAKRLLKLLEQPRLRAAEFHAASRDRAGVRHRAKQLTVIDTEQGRWLVSRQGDRTPGEDWIVAVPGTLSEIAETLYRMHQDTR